MRQRATLCLGICVCLTAGQVWAQHARQRFVRLEAGSLNPSDIFSTTLAVGASAGWQYADRDAVLVRYLRQSQNRAGTDVGKHAANFVTANWEHAFGTGGKYQRQALVRGGAGAVFRYLLHTAPVVDAGFEVRYGLATHWSLVANIEDDLAFVPHQVLQVCSFGSCSLITFDRKLEHNFGLIVAGEWRP